MSLQALATGETSSEKEQRLLANLRGLGSVIIAFSGGADSAFLAWAAKRALGDHALAITALSPSYSEYDRKQAEALIRDWSLRHEFIVTHEVENPLYAANGPDRCYHCKNELFGELERLRETRGFSAVAYGINADDLGDFRPGHRAAREYAVATPLLDARLTKAEIRALSREAGLSTWDRPASACLSSRVPFGTPVGVAELARIERAENSVRELGFRQFRVRAHGELARLEIAPEELPRAMQTDAARTIALRLRQA
jgi:uncharacterized protein